MDAASPELFGAPPLVAATPSPPPSPPSDGTPPCDRGGDRSPSLFVPSPPDAALAAVDDTEPPPAPTEPPAAEPPGGDVPQPPSGHGVGDRTEHSVDRVLDGHEDDGDLEDDPELAALAEAGGSVGTAPTPPGVLASPRPTTPAPVDPVERFRACLAVGQPHAKRLKTAREAPYAHVAPGGGLSKEREFRCWRNYVVFYNGTVIGPSGRVVTGTLTKRGYLQTTGRGRKKLLMHRIVAMAWLAPGTDTDDSTVEVNHADGNRTNNRADNLELVYPDQHKHTDSERRFRAQLSRIKALELRPPPEAP